MVEKFSDYEGTQYINEEGTFDFEVMSAELKQSSSGNPMIVFDVKAPEGSSRLFFSLTPKARWKYNMFIKSCMTPPPELDYETFHDQLIGCHFLGDVVHDYYTATTKVPTADGRFVEQEVEKDSYKIESFHPVV